jgi:hypothetical protein
MPPSMSTQIRGAHAYWRGLNTVSPLLPQSTRTRILRTSVSAHYNHALSRSIGTSAFVRLARKSSSGRRGVSFLEGSRQVVRKRHSARSDPPEPRRGKAAPLADDRSHMHPSRSIWAACPSRGIQRSCGSDSLVRSHRLRDPAAFLGPCRGRATLTIMRWPRAS